MLKLAPKYACCFLALSLMLPSLHALADAKPAKSSSFKSGFSSQRSSSSSSSSSSASRASSSRSSSTSNGGFGSFGSRAPATQRNSDSALSRKLDRDASEARALRTLQERRAAEAARNAPPPRYEEPARNPSGYPGYASRPAPGYGQGAGQGYGQGYGQPPVAPRRDSNLGGVIAGAVIGSMAANASANAHRNNNQAPAQAPAPMEPSTWDGGVGSVNGAATAGAGSGAAATVPPAPGAVKPAARGASLLGTIFTLAVLALLVWGAVKLVRRARTKRAANKPNYSFERN